MIECMKCRNYKDRNFINISNFHNNSIRKVFFFHVEKKTWRESNLPYNLANGGAR